MFSYNVTLSYFANDIRSVTFSITTMNLSTFTGLPNDTLFNITIYGIDRNRDVLSFDSTSVRTIDYESTHTNVQIYKLLANYMHIMYT